MEMRVGEGALMVHAVRGGAAITGRRIARARQRSFAPQKPEAHSPMQGMMAAPAL